MPGHAHKRGHLSAHCADTVRTPLSKENHLQTLLAFIFAILILVSLHEFGHYIVARLCGVKVVRFSVGFGKPFFTRKRGDTEWCLAPIPLGGYVKMVDTREGEVSEADLPYAFDKQHPAKRIAIVAAGPLTNLALAVLLYGLSFSFGVTELRPYVGTVEPDTIAARTGFQSGDKIQSVNGVSVQDWSSAQTEIVLNLEAGKVAVGVQTASGAQTVRTIDAAGTPEAGKIAKNQGYIGLMPFKITTVAGGVEKGSPAEKAGLKPGDRLTAADGKPIASWQEWANLTRQSPGKKNHPDLRTRRTNPYRRHPPRYCRTARPHPDRARRPPSAAGQGVGRANPPQLPSVCCPRIRHGLGKNRFPLVDNPQIFRQTNQRQRLCQPYFRAADHCRHCRTVRRTRLAKLFGIFSVGQHQPRRAEPAARPRFGRRAPRVLYCRMDTRQTFGRTCPKHRFALRARPDDADDGGRLLQRRYPADRLDFTFRNAV